MLWSAVRALAAYLLYGIVALPLSNASPLYQLDQVVVVARHGVRSPTDDHHYAALTGLEWPHWQVAAGYLTQHGYKGMVQQGQYWREQWQRMGLSFNGCPAPQAISLWAAPDQRTRATGSALLAGLYPGCKLTVDHSRYTQDPLFDTVKMGLAKPDPVRILQQIRTRMGTESQLSLRYHSAISDFRQALCSPHPPSCRFLNQPWTISITPRGQVKLGGPLSHAASMAESVRLAYSENLPLSAVAFGHVTTANDVARLMALHAAKYDLVSDTQEYAKHGGSLLMRQIIDALTGGSTHYADRLNKPIVIFVGHDTNIAQLQTMLGFNWQLAQYPRNDIPPGGSLVFMRFHNVRSGQVFVQLRFMARSLDQWRKLTSLSTTQPLFSADYSVAGCFKDKGLSLCPMAVLINHARRELVKDGDSVTLYQ